MQKRVQTALVSVFSKVGLEPLLRSLHQEGVRFISTGGTESFLRELGLPVEPVEKFTQFPAILDGRVKTLHPAVFGGILYRREDDAHTATMEKYGLPSIDLVIVDLYPFEETVASGGSEDEIIEKIDIGGISLIRAAAKNHGDVWIIPHRDAYDEALQIVQSQGALTSLEQRKHFASQAFSVTQHYDSAIHSWMAKEPNEPNEPNEREQYTLSMGPKRTLRYGENPHQKGFFYGPLEKLLQQLHGKELSYNNLLDVDAAVQLMSEFSEPTVAIIKHNNACGVATRSTLAQAWKDALAGDPISAFGGVLVFNRTVDVSTASEMDSLFFEVAIAPEYTPEALEILQKKKNRIILLWKQQALPSLLVRSALNGILVEERDSKTDEKDDFHPVTLQLPTDQELLDLRFASAICKHTKSNTIVLVKNGMLLGSGTGQTSRVDALGQAIHKAKSFNFDLNGAVMASDAFFPFPDCVEIAHQAGITAVIQPGGSVKDDLSIAYCNAHQVAMVCTGTRHFKH